MPAMKSYIDFFESAFSHIAEINKLSFDQIKKLDKTESLCMLPSPSGNGHMICGRAAYEDIRAASNLAWKSSSSKAQILESDVFHELKILFAERFLAESIQATAATAGALAKEAVARASIDVMPIRQFYPVHLGHARGIDCFNIGPVQFISGKKLENEIHDRAADFRSQNSEEYKIIDMLIEDFKSYYSSFTWMAIVDVEPCVPKISRQLGLKIATDALNCLSVFLGHQYAHHMIVGGVSFSIDRRSKLSMTQDGKVRLSSSSDWLSHALGDNWWEHINQNRGDEIIFLMGIAITEGNKLKNSNKISVRFLDALSWYGEAIRDNFVSSSVVKYTTALERLIITKKTSGTLKSIFENRAAALVFAAYRKDLEKYRGRFSRLYDLRSDIVHGKITPFSEEIDRMRYSIDTDVKMAIQQYIYLARENGLRNDVSLRQLDDWLSQIASSADSISGSLSG